MDMIIIYGESYNYFLPALCYYAFATFLLGSLLGRKILGTLELEGEGEGGDHEFMILCAWI